MLPMVKSPAATSTISVGVSIGVLLQDDARTKTAHVAIKKMSFQLECMMTASVSIGLASWRVQAILALSLRTRTLRSGLSTVRDSTCGTPRPRWAAFGLQ